MDDFIINKAKKIVLYQDGEEFYLSINYPKVIFEIESHKEDSIFLKNQIQKSCRYSDFVDCFEFICDYMFSKENVNKIITPRPCFAKELFVSDNYDFEGDYIVKTRSLEKRKD